MPHGNSGKTIRLSKSCLSQEEKEAVIGVLDREFLGMGTEVQRFEEELSHYFGRPALCVVNGTAALHLALQSAGIGVGDEVLVPSLTYVASFQAIAACGARPVSCDVLPHTLTIDWRDAERRLTERTRAVMPVHYAGGVGDLDGVFLFAGHHGLRVVEDAAHAFGSRYRDRLIGGFGDVTCFSFDGIKNITSGEGGCLVSEDRQLLQHVQDSRLLGVERDTERRFAGERSWEFDVSIQGWRYHMSNLMAAIGLRQLHRREFLASIRQARAERYRQLLAPHGGIGLLEQDYGAIVPHIFPIVLPRNIDRDRLRHNLQAMGIQTGVHYQPNHWLTMFKDHQADPLPVTDAIAKRLLSLPLHPDLTEEDVDYVCASLIDAIRRAGCLDDNPS